MSSTTPTNNFLTLLTKIAEEHFNRKVHESKPFKLFISFIGKNIEKKMEMELKNNEENVEMEKIIHSHFLNEMKQIENVIYIHSMILRSSYKVNSANSFIDFLRSKSEQLLGLFFNSYEEQTRVYDQLMSDYNSTLDSFTNRNSVLGPAAMQNILNDRESYVLFEKLVTTKWFPQTRNKVLIEGLIYSFSWLLKPKRIMNELIEFAALPTLPPNFGGLVILFCYYISVEKVPVENFGELLGLIEKYKPQTFNELLGLDDCSFNKLMIRLGLDVGKKMQFNSGNEFQLLSKQILLLTSKQEASEKKIEILGTRLNTTNLELEKTKQESMKLRIVLEKTMQELDKTRQELEKTNQELEETRQELEKTNQELDKTRQELEKTRQEAEKSTTELDKTKQELEKTKQEAEKSNTELSFQLETTNQKLLKINEEVNENKVELNTTKKLLEEMVARYREAFSSLLDKEVHLGEQTFMTTELLNDQDDAWNRIKFLQEKLVEIQAECNESKIQNLSLQKKLQLLKSVNVDLEKKAKILELELVNKNCNCGCKCSLSQN